jgi:hypothetical protein
VAGELAGDRNRDDGAALAAPLERVPTPVEAAGAAVGLGADGGGLSLWRRASVALSRSGRRCCQAASTSSRRACVLPVLVIEPSRRRSPLESSLGVRPRNGPKLCGRKRVQSPNSTVSASAVKVETPRRQQRRPTVSG